MHGNVRNHTLLASIMLMLAATANAQEGPWSWGAWATIGASVSASRIGALPGVATCRSEELPLVAGGGVRLGLGGEIGWRRAGSPVGLGARIGIGVRGATFTAEESAGSIAVGGNALTPLVIEHVATVDMSELVVMPLVRWQPLAPIVVSAGPQIVMPLGAGYDERERIVSPSQAFFFDESGAQSRERNHRSGSLSEETAVWLGVGGSVGAELPVGSILLRPEIGGLLALGSPIGSIDWRPHEVHVGLGVIFGAAASSTPITPLPD